MMENLTDNVVADAFEFFKDECRSAADRTYEKLLTGLGGMDGIECQRAIKDRINKVRIRMRHEPGMDALDVAKWLYGHLEKAAQKRDDLP